MADEKKPTRKQVIDTVGPKMIKFQSNIENAVFEKETGRHQVSVMVVDGVITKVQIFTEDTVDLMKSSINKK